MKRIASWLLLAAMLPATAQNVTFNGLMGERALLVIDGQPKVLTPGQSFGGVKVESVTPDEAHVQVNGRSVVLRQGTPVNLGGGGGGADGQEIILSAGPGGHFRTGGSMRGEAAPYGAGTLGRLPAEYHASACAADYVVYSYATPIAWHGPDGWVMPDESYSVTTSKQQGRIRTALSVLWDSAYDKYAA